MTAAEILMREHREALTRMDPAQVRAVCRIAKAAADPERGREESLEHQVECEAGHLTPRSGIAVPQWMLG